MIRPRSITLASLCLPLVAVAVFAAPTAGAAPTPPVVLSDTIHFKAIATAPGPGPFRFRSTSCALTSDGESGVVFACQESGQFIFSATGTGSGSAKVTSGDGTTTWKFTLTPIGTNTYQMAGKGYEIDNEGPPQPLPYPAQVAGTITVVPGPALSMSGTESVYESATAP